MCSGEGGGSADSPVLEAQSFSMLVYIVAPSQPAGREGGQEFSAFQMALRSNRKRGCKNTGGFIYMDCMENYQ